jgi:L-alanine-DL-glutamate epimerase-like enolase superfamily enzyme
MLAQPYTVDAGGRVVVPQAPGFGFELDWQVVRDCTIEAWASGGEGGSP